VPRKRRHDEELRQQLLDVAAERIARYGLDGLSLRALATAAGTSTTAVYSLFGGKPGLLSAMHERAFQRFGAEQAAVGVSDDPVEDVVQLGLAYRRSAIADPHGYRIMFGDEVVPADVAPEVRDAAAATFLPLLDAVRRCAATGRFRDDTPVQAIATALWANVHGLVLLELGRFMPPTAGEPATVFERAVRAVARGWSASVAASASKSS
jgi:AcrR family transcriptional regulator